MFSGLCKSNNLFAVSFVEHMSVTPTNKTPALSSLYNSLYDVEFIPPCVDVGSLLNKTQFNC